MTYVELEAKCAELQQLLDRYIEAFDVMNDSMTWAHRIIAEPDSIAVIDLPTESMVAKNAELLAALQQCVSLMDNGGTWTLEHQAQARAAIAKAEGDMP